MLAARIFSFLVFIVSAFATPYRYESQKDAGSKSLARRSNPTYSVTSGDTGIAISVRYSITFNTLSAFNPNVNWNDLQIGQVLQQPSHRTPYTYQVVRGDTGNAISSKYGILFSDLSAANPGVTWTNLQIGQKLQVPGYGKATTYSIVSGDTATAIAANFEITLSSLSAANKNVNLNQLKIGQILQIPAGTSPSQASTPMPSPTSGSPVSSSSTTTTSSRTSTTTLLTTTTTRTTTTTLKSTTTQSSQPGVFAPTTFSSSSTTSSFTSSSFSLTTRPTSSSSSVSLQTSTTFPTSSSSRTSSTSASVSLVPIAPSPTTRSTTTTLSSLTSPSTSSTLSTSTTSTHSSTVSVSTSISTTSTTASSGEPAVTNAGTVAAPNAVTTINNSDGVGSLPDKYVFYSGDGSAADGWPVITSWVSFSAMWTANLPYIGANCAFASGSGAPNSATETGQVYDAIQAVAAKSQLDHRFILAIMMQESRGCVRVPTTFGSHANPGLMQSFEGTGTCNNDGTVSNPCPVTEIFQMIEDGVFGTASGDGLVQGMNYGAGGGGFTGAEAFYRAARYYNSGSVPSSGDLGAPGATRCYASDIANRLTGWVVAQSQCTLD